MNPNCLSDGNNFAIYDHELAFIKPPFGWQPPWVLGGLSYLNHPSAHIFTNGLKGQAVDFSRLAEAWEAISDMRLDQYRNALPVAWSNQSHAIDEILGYIAQLIGEIRPALTEVARILA